LPLPRQQIGHQNITNIPRFRSEYNPSLSQFTEAAVRRDAAASPIIAISSKLATKAGGSKTDHGHSQKTAPAAFLRARFFGAKPKIRCKPTAVR
jgi:hypothetical protein